MKIIQKTIYKLKALIFRNTAKLNALMNRREVLLSVSKNGIHNSPRSIYAPGALYHLCLSVNKFYKTVFKLSQQVQPVLQQDER